MNHLNIANLEFTNRPLTYKHFSVPASSFWRGMSWAGHGMGDVFTIEVPAELTPVRADPEMPDSALILPADSFNVMKPFKIVPAVTDQEGTLVFGSTGDYTGYEFSILAGRELILASASKWYPAQKQIVFAAVLRRPQWIAIGLGRKSAAGVEVFTVQGKKVISREAYYTRIAQLEERERQRQRAAALKAEQDEAKQKLANGDWRLA